MNPKFDVGAVVKLKSGGPLMTVEGVKSEDVRLCTWFDSTHHVQRGLIPVACLAQAPAK